MQQQQIELANPFTKLEYPELFFGFVSAVGTNIDETILEFKRKLEALDYTVEVVSISKLFPVIEKRLKLGININIDDEYERIKSSIEYGNALRSYFKNKELLAATAISKIVGLRPKSAPYFEKRAYLLTQFKRKEEIDLLRSVYGRLFFQVSVYSRRAARVEYLSRRFADAANDANAKAYRKDAEELVQIDENEATNDFGQRVAKVFHDADYIVSVDSQSPTIANQVERFCELLFSSNCISPTKHEYGMFLAKAAALRTLDLSRQVGAALFSDGGEVICLGSNEVPKAKGGTYWSDEEFDDREYRRKFDSNDKRKKELLLELFQAYDPTINISNILKSEKITNSQFMDSLEYGRIVHAEMSAISDAARNGRALKNSVMYTTTFPCHMCAKHIVAAGIAKVVFLEPYPKSLAETLHSDSIEFEGNERGKFAKFPAVKFEHFFGVTPRRYRELFERGARKSAGKFLQYKDAAQRPNIDIITPFYKEFENAIMKEFAVFLNNIQEEGQ